MSELHDALGLRPDSDYAARPPARDRRRGSRRVAAALTATGAMLVGFLLAAGLDAGRDAAREQGARKAELIALIDARQARADAQATQLEQLRAEVAAAEEAVVAAGAPSLNSRLDAIEASTGLTGLAGPGLRVTFSDASGACATGREEDCRIQDVDLQLAVNTLWGVGAEGVAVNGERVIATTAIRSAGSAILVNYRVLTSPYVLEAVGDPVALRDGFERSQLAGDFAAWRDAYGLGFEVAEVDELVLPAYSGSVRLPTAEHVEAAGEDS